MILFNQYYPVYTVSHLVHLYPADKFKKYINLTQRQFTHDIIDEGYQKKYWLLVEVRGGGGQTGIKDIYIIF